MIHPIKKGLNEYHDICLFACPQAGCRRPYTCDLSLKDYTVAFPRMRSVGKHKMTSVPSPLNSISSVPLIIDARFFMLVNPRPTRVPCIPLPLSLTEIRTISTPASFVDRLVPTEIREADECLIQFAKAS